MKKKYTITVQQEVEIEFPYYFRYEFGSHVCFGKITEETINMIEVSFKLVIGAPMWDYQFTVEKSEEEVIGTYLGYHNRSSENEWNEQMEKFSKYFTEKFGNIRITL